MIQVREARGIAQHQQLRDRAAGMDDTACSVRTSSLLLACEALHRLAVATNFPQLRSRMRLPLYARRALPLL